MALNPIADIKERYPFNCVRYIVKENSSREVKWRGLTLALSHESGWKASIKVLKGGGYAVMPEMTQMDSDYGMAMLGNNTGLILLERGKNPDGYYIGFTLNPFRWGDIS